MASTASVVFLIDVDNTLLDNDHVIADLGEHLTAAFGADRQEEYWRVFDSIRDELGYADYLGALQRYRARHPWDPKFIEVSLFLLDYPFANRLYPQSLDVIKRLRSYAPTAILTDGDVVFQPRKIERSGLLDAVDGQVLIFIHKEAELAEVEKRYPAEHYVMIDDKLRILTAMKKIWGGRLTTVFPRQGHYAADPEVLANNPPADVTIDRIGELLNWDLDRLVSASRR